MAYASVKDVQKFLRFSELAQAVSRPATGAATAEGYSQVTIPSEPGVYADDLVLWDSLSDEMKQSLIPSFLDEGTAVIDSYLYARYPDVSFPVTFAAADSTKPLVLQFQEQLKNACAAFAAMSTMDKVNAKNAQEFKTQIQLNWEKRLQFFIDIQENKTNPPAMALAVKQTVPEEALPENIVYRDSFTTIEQTRSRINGRF